MSSAACGGSGQPKAVLPPLKTTSASDAASSAPDVASAGGVLTTDQLKAALLGASDVTGYTTDPGKDQSRLALAQRKATVGGPLCQKFLDATDGLVGSYGTVATVSREFQNTGKHVGIQVQLMSYGSADQAGKAVADAKAGLAGCKKVATTDSRGQAFTLELTPAPDSKDGDSSADWIAIFAMSGKSALMVGQVIQVGATTETIAVLLPASSDKAKIAAVAPDLQSVRQKEVAKLRAAQNH